MTHEETAKVLEGGLIGGQFRLHYPIGEGGMGTVWAAEDLRLGRMVAAKFLSRHMAAQPRVRERFQREARMTARVRSTHVVQVFAEGCTEDDVPYLIMELLDGEDLATRLHRRGRLELAETGLIVEQICRGLSQAHSEGLVHRDIKPHNIFLSKSEDANSSEPVVKLLDFGIAKDLSSLRDSLTACGEVVGSALYSSPEQLREPQSVDRAADIWAIGIVIFEMLTGRVSYEASTLSELIGRHSDGVYPKPSSLVPSLDRHIDAFVSRTLHSVASKRWSSVEELSQQYAALVRKRSGVTGGFGAAQTSPAQEKERPRPLRSTFVVLALALLLFVAALTWRELFPGPAAASREELSTTGYIESAARSTDAGAPAPPTSVESPEPPLPEERGATQPADLQPKPPASHSKMSQKKPSAEAPAPAEKPQPRDEHQRQTELPGRNHGF